MHPLFTKIQLLLAALSCTVMTFGQVAIGTNTPSPGAILTVNADTKGVLLPRLSAAQQSILAATLTSAEAGMLVTDAISGSLMGWNGKAFVPAANLTAVAPLTVSATNQVSINAGTQVGDLITWNGTNWVNMQPATQHFTFGPLDNRQPWLAMNYCIAENGIFPTRNDATPFLSQIQLFPFNFTPRNWAQCNGQLLSISSNTALFSLLGTNYGGDGKTNFALPDLRGRVSVDFGNGPGLAPYTQGQTGGVESTTVTR